MKENQDKSVEYKCWVEYTNPQKGALLPNFENNGGLLPVIVQDGHFHLVYALTHTREAELLETRQSGRMVFYSVYSKTRCEGVLEDGTELWVEDIFLDSKGESFLYLVRRGKEAINVCPKRTSFFRLWLGLIQSFVKRLKDNAGK